MTAAKVVKTQSKGMVTIPVEFREKLQIDGNSLLEAADGLGVDALITLDRKGFKTKKLQAADSPFTILTPGEFLQTYLNSTLRKS